MKISSKENIMVRPIGFQDTVMNKRTEEYESIVIVTVPDFENKSIRIDIHKVSDSEIKDFLKKYEVWVYSSISNIQYIARVVFEPDRVVIPRDSAWHLLLRQLLLTHKE
jgi:hypothetical protein